MSGAIPPLPQYVFMAWCLVKPRDNFTFIWVGKGKTKRSEGNGRKHSQNLMSS
jgi:hypothetical protein